MVAGGAVLLMVLVAALAALPAVRTANRVQVVDVLRAKWFLVIEGMNT